MLRTKYFLIVIVVLVTVLSYFSLTRDEASINSNEVVQDKLDDNHERKDDSSVSSNRDHIQHKRKKHKPRKVKRILYWNDYYGSRNFGFCCGRGPYIKNQCSNTDCSTSKDRSEDLESFDAIVFHGRSLNYKDIPARRYPHQHYIFLTIESAAYPGTANLSVWDNFFNLTMTYKQDSDVPLSYGRVKRKENVYQSSMTTRKHKAKKHLAAWLVSNCNTQSKREILIEELKRYLPEDSVHVYGKCGTRRCPGDSPTDRDQCWRMLENDYKFYLALENSVCPDYVTEKMYEALKHDIVPVVLGGADYDAMFPPHSFINMMNYSNMSSLAEHLLQLDQDDAQYMKYLEWKSLFSILNSKEEFNQGHCLLCDKLHNLGNSKEKKVVNLRRWFLEDNPCKSHPSLVG